MKKLFSEIPYLQSERLIIREIKGDDAGGLLRLVNDPEVYKYLPTFLFEKKYEDIHYVINRLYDECFPESIILGIFMNGEFCGLIEMYGYNDNIHKVSVGYRLLRSFWGMGIATESLKAVLDYLVNETDIEMITASTMIDNKASANVLRKAGFELVSSGEYEDWGYEAPTQADKWIF